MKLSEYLAHDAVALAERVASREVNAAELLDLAIQQSARTQARTNAICRMMEHEARARIERQPSGPFSGVPFLIKDCAQDYAGLPTSFGSRALAKNVASEHAHVVRRYLDAGFVIFGKTNLPELALKGVSDSQAFGRGCNPWNIDHTPGGSSGGAAAAVASGVKSRGDGPVPPVVRIKSQCSLSARSISVSRTDSYPSGTIFRTIRKGDVRTLFR